MHHEVDEARELLEAARVLPLPAEDETRRAALASRLAPATWHELAPQVGKFARTLRRLPIVNRTSSS